MKKIVPFTKDLMFKTKIGEITSIALDNTLKLDKEFVSGEFIVSGTYKMLEGSQIEEEFKYNIPVDITIDSKYDTSKCMVSIDDFSYEIINEEKLKVNISVMLDDLDIKDDPIETIEVMVDASNRESEEIKEERKDEDSVEDLLNDIDAQLSNMAIGSGNTAINNEITINNNSNNSKESEKTFEDEILNNISDDKEYSIYRVYTVKENDTLDIIYDKFNVTKEILMDYNDLDNISVGSKIIIPSTDE